MQIKKRYSHVILTIFSIILLAGFLYFGMQPQIAEANSSLILEAPSISLTSPIRVIELNSDYTLTSPDRIAGLYQAAENNTFIIGHSSTIFSNLKNLKPNDHLIFNGKTYLVKTYVIQKKSEISMSKVLEAKLIPTLTLMTCHGKKIAKNDYTERIIITAELTSN